MTCNTSGMLLILYYIKIGMEVIFIITPIILLVMCSVDMLKAVTGNKDSIAKAWSNVYKRMIIAIVILILPSIISLLLSVTNLGSYGECFNKATKTNIAALEKEEAAKKEMEEKALVQKAEENLAKMATIFDELSAKLKEAQAKIKEKLSPSGTLIDRNYTTSASATGMLNVAKAQIGNKGGQKYWSWWGYSSRPPWCAIFVSWVANENGLIDKGVIPKFEGCRNGVAWFKNKGQWKDRSYSPQPGDIVFFDWNGDGRSDHVGIVEYVSGGKVHTIEGNVSDQVGRRVRSTSEILGYGVPKY